jgi:cell wall assembly regulator SMI1
MVQVRHSMLRPDLNWVGTLQPVSEDAVVNVERKFGYVFPAAFRTLVREVHGGHPDTNEFVYQDPVLGPVATGLSELLSVDVREAGNIIAVHEWVADRLPAGVIPFGSDGGGDYVCFDFREDASRPRVVYWMHEKPPSAAIVPLAESFDGFLNMLRNPTPIPA